MEDNEEFSDDDVESAKARWRSAKSMSELCELGAGFLEGTVPFFPGYLSPSPADETEPLVEELARLNRSGFLTVGSQPGFDGDGFDEKNWKQRA